MVITKSNPTYYIASGAVQFVENALENANRIAISVATGTVVMVHIPGTIDYANDGNFRRWTLRGYNTLLMDQSAQHIYARLNKNDQLAMIVFSVNDYTLDEDDTYYFLKIGAITAPSGGKREISYDSGLLGTYRGVAESSFDLFVPVDSEGNELEKNSANLDRIFAVKPKNGWGFFSDSFSSAFGLNPNGSNRLYLSDLLGVELDGLRSGQSLVWDGEKWINQTVSGGGGVDFSLALTGAGNAVTSLSYINGVLTATKGSTFLTGITSKLVADALGFTPFDSASFTKAKIQETLGIRDWALKEALEFSDITGKAAFSQLPDMYWANVKVSSASKTNTTPTFASVKIGDATLSWDATNKALKINTGVYSELFSSAFGVNNTGALGAALADLNYVSITNPSKGQALVYDGTNWVNQTVSEGGGTGSISINQTGSGNAVTSLSLTNGVLTATKGGTFLTSQSLADYAKKTDMPTSLPASDVYAWAKAATKPSYSFSEIGSKPTTISGYGITDAITTGNIGSQSVAYATGSAVVHSAASITNLNSPTWGGEGALTYNLYSSTASNKPVSIDNANFVITMNCTKHGTAGYYGWQIAGSDGDGALYARYFTAGTFYSWKQFAFKTSVSGTLSVADGTVLTWTNGLLSKIS